MNELADALKRLLSKRQDKPRHVMTWYGHWSGKVGDLFIELTCDERYKRLKDRPHETTKFRAYLKKHAAELHELGVIVTLDRQKVWVELVNAPSIETQLSMP